MDSCSARMMRSVIQSGSLRDPCNESPQPFAPQALTRRHVPCCRFGALGAFDDSASLFKSPMSTFYYVLKITCYATGESAPLVSVSVGCLVTRWSCFIVNGFLSAHVFLGQAPVVSLKGCPVFVGYRYDRRCLYLPQLKCCRSLTVTIFNTRT